MMTASDKYRDKAFAYRSDASCNEDPHYYLLKFSDLLFSKLLILFLTAD
jgi:hypothetical protein